MPVSIPVVGLLVSLVTTVGVYVHATRSGLSQSASLLWAGCVGVVSFGGFLFAYSFGDGLHRLFLQRVRPTSVAMSPYEGTVLRVAVGVAVSALGVLFYGVGRGNGSVDAD